MAVITISRQPGTFGDDIAARIAGHLGFTLVDRAYLAGLWREDDLDEANLDKIDQGLPVDAPELDSEIETSIKLLSDLIAQLAEEQDLVVIGRAAQGLFRNRAGALHIKVTASRHIRVKQLQHTEGLSARQARSHIRELENRRICYLRYLYGMNWNDPSIYDLILNMDRLSISQTVNLILAAVDETRIQDVPRSQIVADLLPEMEERQGNGRFVHDAEEQFANFFDFYGIAYEYEPRTFTLETDDDGKISEAFTPDFYIQLASVRDQDRVLKIIKDNARDNQRNFVGVIDPINPNVEMPETVRDRILMASKLIPLNQLSTTDDCGFSPFGDDTSTAREIAFDKIKARIIGTQLASKALGL